MINKPWVLTLHGQPCRLKKGPAMVQKTWDINKAMWFRDEDAFKTWRVSWLAMRNFEDQYPFCALKPVRKRWWRLWLWRKLDRYHSSKDSLLKTLDLNLFEFIHRQMTR